MNYKKLHNKQCLVSYMNIVIEGCYFYINKCSLKITIECAEIPCLFPKKNRSKPKINFQKASGDCEFRRVKLWKIEVRNVLA